MSVLVRVSDPTHAEITALAQIQQEFLGRRVTLNEVLEMLVASYKKNVERESEDDYDYGSREPGAPGLQDPRA